MLQLEKYFLYHASIIAVIGVVLGALLGVGLCLLQHYTGFITLDESNYYVAVAPVKNNMVASIFNLCSSSIYLFCIFIYSFHY
jgi:lipoprotein-releasing system permease protein